MGDEADAAFEHELMYWLSGPHSKEEERQCRLINQAPELLAKRVWLTNELEQIPLRELEDSHIENILAFAKRNGDGPELIWGLWHSWRRILKLERARRKRLEGYIYNGDVFEQPNPLNFKGKF